MNMNEFYSEFLFRYQTDGVFCVRFPSMLIAFREVFNTAISSNGIVITKAFLG